MNEICAMLLICLLPSEAVSAQQPDAPDAAGEAAAQRAAWRELLDRQPSQYEIHLDTEPKTRLTLRKTPVLRWSNFTRVTRMEAGTFVWTAKGRPEVVACCFTISSSGTTIRLDFQSLSRVGLAALRNGQRVWHPANPGVEFRPVPEAAEPADSAAARLRQMKSLARRFRCTLLGWRADRSDREELRMLPRPVYRYESEDPDVLDGAMFLFVQGTDPEVVLLLEAVRQASGFQWQFAMARRSSGPLTAQFGGQTVWEVPAQHQPRNSGQTRIEFDHRVSR